MSMRGEAVPRVAILGSSGSIGRQTLQVIDHLDGAFEVVALAVHGNTALLEEQASKYPVRHVAVGDTSRVHSLHLDDSIRVSTGPEAVADLAALDDVDIVVNALSGAAGLRATYNALRTGKRLGLANKESLVVAGDLFMPMVGTGNRAEGAPSSDLSSGSGSDSCSGPSAGASRLGLSPELLPIDSEHSALFQCLLGERGSEVENLWLTASGGPFFGWTREELASVKAQDALAHPTWNMGPKITVDSATLMNKGFEAIEAHHLFGMAYDKIQIVVHPQSCIHSMVEYRDGSVKAHLGVTDMRVPIQYALSYPEREAAPVKPLDFRELGALTFDAPDSDTFRCLALALAAGEEGGTLRVC